MEINKQTRNYIVQSIILVLVLYLLGHLAMRFWALDIVVPMAVSMVFVLVVEVATALVWRWVALKHQDMLPSFFTGASGFRFLGALAVMSVCFFVTDRNGMLAFFVVFMVYYFVSLIHHSAFFSKMSNRL